MPDTSSSRVLVDSSILIAAFDQQGSSVSEMQEKAKQTMRRLAKDASLEIVLSPLILHETLRGVLQAEQERFEALEKAISDFPVLPINEQVTSLATSLFRHLVATDPNVNARGYGRNYDLMHFATAKHYDCGFEHNENSGFAGYQAAYDAIQLNL